jgi:extracellular elastinolytic metalloproteinase
MNRSLSLSLRGALACAVAATIVGGASAAERQAPGLSSGERHYDARIQHNKAFRAAPSGALHAFALRDLSRAVPEMAVERDAALGVVRSLSNPTGYLTGDRGGDHLTVATDFVKQQAATLGLEDQDLEDYEVTNSVFSEITGVTHIYMRQRYQGLPVYNAQLHVNVSPEGRILSVNNSFLSGLARAANGARPRINLAAAVSGAMTFAGTPRPAPRMVQGPQGPQAVSIADHAGISLEPIRGQLMWLPIRQGEARLVWNFQIQTLDKQHWWDMTVDAATGQVWTRFDWIASDSYRVYQRPVESPNHTTPVQPADGRVLVTNPANATASPFGWHDTNGAAGAEFTTTEGNNVSAYTDTNADNVADAGSSPSGGAGLNFDFVLNLANAPSTYRPAAVTNLFYWNNTIHDVQYQYGFNEAAGNFQVNNYGRGGAGNDSVRAEAQDGSGTNNANFGTPADGQRPRMQMFIWTAPTPDRDGDIDNGIVIHEYGHGISNRLVGGPANVNCLTNSQQPGEGLSDWWALAYTAKTGDTGPMGRGMGTYALNQPTTGLGIRTQRYSTDPAINTWTYASINGMAIPHGVGSVWTQAAWEAYWKLVNFWGFDQNLFNATGSAGNQRMMLYVNEGLKNTACNPTFTQVRDGIIQAATSSHGGEDVCRLWEAFAAFGLGTNAVSGGANSTSPTNGFNVPASCQNGGTVVFTDDFETNKGWTTNPNGTDTATTGQWARANPEPTTSNGTKQVGTTTSGVNDLVTGPLAGASAGVNDIDGGVTSIRSPAITLPATGTLTLSFNWYFALGSNATNADFFRVRIVGSSTTTTVFERLGSGVNVNGAFAAASVSLNAFAGQTVRIQIEAADAGTASLVEAGVDDVKITQN